MYGLQARVSSTFQPRNLTGGGSERVNSVTAVPASQCLPGPDADFYQQSSQTTETTPAVLMQNDPNGDSARSGIGSLSLRLFVFFRDALRPQKPYALLGTGRGKDWIENESPGPAPSLSPARNPVLKSSSPPP